MIDIGIVMDPLDTLNLKKDTTLSMLRAAQRRGWRVHYMQQDDLHLAGGEARARMQVVELLGRFAESLYPGDVDGPWYRLEPPVVRPLADLDVVLMRKDPPFDMEFVYSTYLLERAEQAGTRVINRPASLRDCNEKVFATEFPQCGPPLVIARRADLLKAFQAEHGDVVFKPLDGMGGASIFRIRPGDPNLNVVIETLSQHGRTQVMCQKYIPEIVDGDKRILLIDGEPVPYALARVPMAGESRGNLAAGGTGVGRELTARDRWICSQVGPELVRRGLRFVGIDVIGDYLTEINVTCPTCVRELDAQFGLDIAGTFMDRLAADLQPAGG